MNTIICPHCHREVEITQALTHQIQENILAKEKDRHERQLSEVRRQAFDDSLKKTQEQFSLQLKTAREDASEKDIRIKELIEQITELSKELRASKKEKDEAKLIAQKQLEKDEDRIRLEEKEKAQEEQRLKILEKEKQLQDALKANEDMRRKLEQGSQQLQGEVFELQFADTLRREFPNDRINEVGKGVRGGDIIQEVIDRNNNYCGKILWELKNTKTWSEGWIDKLKTDQRGIMADFAVIVSEAVPETILSAKYHKGVWITKQNFTIGLACSLRINLIQVSIAKRSLNGKKEKSDILYEYLTGTEFRLRVEAIIEAFSNMQNEIEKEKRYFSNKWARDEKNIRQVIDNTYGMHGDLKGIMGSALPQVKGIESAALDTGNR